MKQLIRNIIGISLMAAIPATTTIAAETEIFETAIEQDLQSISIEIKGKTLTIKNAENLTLKIYSITGEEVYTKSVDSPSRIFDLNHLRSGCYIIKVGNTARKVYLK